MEKMNILNIYSSGTLISRISEFYLCFDIDLETNNNFIPFQAS